MNAVHKNELAAVWLFLIPNSIFELPAKRYCFISSSRFSFLDLFKIIGIPDSWNLNCSESEIRAQLLRVGCGLTPRSPPNLGPLFL